MRTLRICQRANVYRSLILAAAGNGIVRWDAPSREVITDEGSTIVMCYEMGSAYIQSTIWDAIHIDDDIPAGQFENWYGVIVMHGKKVFVNGELVNEW